jgi:hypothetical protein
MLIWKITSIFTSRKLSKRLGSFRKINSWMCRRFWTFTLSLPWSDAWLINSMIYVKWTNTLTSVRYIEKTVLHYRFLNILGHCLLVLPLSRKWRITTLILLECSHEQMTIVNVFHVPNMDAFHRCWFQHYISRIQRRTQSHRMYMDVFCSIENEGDNWEINQYIINRTSWST